MMAVRMALLHIILAAAFLASVSASGIFREEPSGNPQGNPWISTISLGSSSFADYTFGE